MSPEKSQNIGHFQTLCEPVAMSAKVLLWIWPMASQSGTVWSVDVPCFPHPLTQPNLWHPWQWEKLDWAITFYPLHETKSWGPAWRIDQTASPTQKVPRSKKPKRRCSQKIRAFLSWTFSQELDLRSYVCVSRGRVLRDQISVGMGMSTRTPECHWRGMHCATLATRHNFLAKEILVYVSETITQISNRLSIAVKEQKPHKRRSKEMRRVLLPLQKNYRENQPHPGASESTTRPTRGTEEAGWRTWKYGALNPAPYVARTGSFLRVDGTWLLFKNKKKFLFDHSVWKIWIQLVILLNVSFHAYKQCSALSQIIWYLIYSNQAGTFIFDLLLETEHWPGSSSSCGWEKRLGEFHRRERGTFVIGVQRLCWVFHVGFFWIVSSLCRVCRYFRRRKLLRKCFQEWHEQWWVARKEWGLGIRADLHCRCVEFCSMAAPTYQGSECVLQCRVFQQE